MSEPQASKANGAEPVLETPKAKNLVQKLCEVMAAVGYTQKTGWNEAQRYHYVTEADIAEKIRPELAKRNVIIFPTLVSTTRTSLTRPMKDYVKTSYATDVVMRWTVVDGDSGEQFVCDIPGCSESPGDKGVYVAITGSEKYLLMKLFLLPTGDDPEDTSNEPTGTTEAAQAVGKAKLSKLKEKIAGTAPESQEQPPDKPIVLFSVALERDLFEISGDSYIMQANSDILLKHGIKHVDKKVGRATVRTNAEGLDAFKYLFEQRGGMLKALKPVE